MSLFLENSNICISFQWDACPSNINSILFYVFSLPWWSLSQVINKLGFVQDSLFIIILDPAGIQYNNYGLLFIPLKIRRSGRKFCSFYLTRRWKYSTIRPLDKSHPNLFVKFQWDIFARLSVGRLYPNEGQRCSGRRKFMAVRNGSEKSNLLSCRLVLILICAYTRRELMNYRSLKYRHIRFTPLTLQNIVKALRNKQRLRIAHSQTRYWKTFQLCKTCCFLVLGFEETDGGSSLVNGELRLCYPKLWSRICA